MDPALMILILIYVVMILNDLQTILVVARYSLQSYYLKKWIMSNAARLKGLVKKSRDGSAAVSHHTAVPVSKTSIFLN